MWWIFTVENWRQISVISCTISVWLLLARSSNANECRIISCHIRYQTNHAGCLNTAVLFSYFFHFRIRRDFTVRRFSSRFSCNHLLTDNVIMLVGMQLDNSNFSWTVAYETVFISMPSQMIYPWNSNISLRLKAVHTPDEVCVSREIRTIQNVLGWSLENYCLQTRRLCDLSHSICVCMRAPALACLHIRSCVCVYEMQGTYIHSTTAPISLLSNIASRKIQLLWFIAQGQLPYRSVRNTDDRSKVSSGSGKRCPHPRSVRTYIVAGIIASFWILISAQLFSTKKQTPFVLQSHRGVQLNDPIPVNRSKSQLGEQIARTFSYLEHQCWTNRDQEFGRI